MARGKMQSEQQVTDEEGQRLLRSVLPSHWRLRDYRPDFGLDFALELFQTRSPDADGPAGAETLGEHLFIQLKSFRSRAPAAFALNERTNVQKTERVVGGGEAGTLDTYRYPLEREELVTVERMGLGTPVLLVVADLASMRCSFVCLNDYIDRILIPLHADYRSAGRRTVHVPVHNDLSSSYGRRAVGWYGKRAKLIAAFQRFHYQLIELEYARSRDDFMTLAQTFAAKISAYDFWDDANLPVPLIDEGAALRRFIATGSAPSRQDGDPTELPIGHERVVLEEGVLDMWRRLALLGRTLEDVWQEWYLPTALGQMVSKPPSATDVVAADVGRGT